MARLIMNRVHKDKTKRRHTLSFEMTVVFLMILVLITTAQMLYFSNVILRKVDDDAQDNVQQILSLCKTAVDDRLLQVFEPFVSLKLTVESILNISNYSHSQFSHSSNITLLQNQIESIYISNASDLVGITLYLSELNITLNAGFGLDAYYVDYLNEYQTSPDSVRPYEWINPNDDLLNLSQSSDSLGIIAPLYGTQGQLYGYMLFRFKPDIFKKVLTDFTIFEHGYMVMVSEDGSLLFNSVEAQYMLSYEAIDHLRNQSTRSGIVPKEKNDGMMILYETLSYCNWHLAAVYMEADVLSAATVYRAYPLVTLALCAVGIFVVFLIVQARVTRPAIALANKVQHAVSPTSLPARWIRRNNELDVIDGALDSMLQQINDLIIGIQKEQEMRQKYAIHLLQEQIKPHFLYNTLFAIDQLVCMKDIENAHKMLNALSQFYRIGLNQGNDLLSVGEELQLTEQYLKIQQIRYGDEIRYQINVCVDCMSAMVTKMTLQPLVENAIYHGIMAKTDSDDGGNIDITVVGERDMIRLTVHDDGAGMDATRLKKTREELLLQEDEKTSCFALSNVYRRLRLYFGEKCRLTIDSEPNNGTSVTIEIPRAWEGIHV